MPQLHNDLKWVQVPLFTLNFTDCPYGELRNGAVFALGVSHLDQAFLLFVLEGGSFTSSLGC